MNMPVTSFSRSSFSVNGHSVHLGNNGAAIAGMTDSPNNVLACVCLFAWNVLPKRMMRSMPVTLSPADA